MQIIRYKDPYSNARYGTAVDIILEDDIPPEQLQEVQQFLDDDYRRIQNSRRYDRAHEYSLEGRLFEGLDYAYRKTPEWIYLRNERDEELYDAMTSLTETQKRRFRMLWEDGLSIREIARREEADYSSVLESIRAARKKLKHILSAYPIKGEDLYP